MRHRGCEHLLVPILVLRLLIAYDKRYVSYYKHLRWLPLECNLHFLHLREYSIPLLSA